MTNTELQTASLRTGHLRIGDLRIGHLRTGALGAAAALAMVACGSSETAAPPVPPPPTATGPATPAAPPPAPGQLDGPPLAVAVPALPGVSFTVEASAEYQVDAMGSPRDAQLYLFRNGELVTTDSDSGDGVDARIVQFFEPGTYEIRVGEWRVRQMSARVQVTALAPLTPVGSVTPGRPTVVNVPHADSARESSAEVTLRITRAGTYRIDVTDPTNQFDPEGMLIQGTALLAQDSDSGEGRAAQITRALEPGEYRVRVRDWINRAAPLTVTVTAS